MKKPVKPITIEDGSSLDYYFKDMAKEPRISNEREIELSKRIQEGDKEATDELVRANLRFVITVAKQFQNRGLTLEDLIAEGNTGLIRAASSYNWEKYQVHFISYAVWWIRQAIKKAIYWHASDVRLPTSQIEPKIKILKASNTFEQQFNREPSLLELAELTGFTEEYIRKVQLSSNKCISIDTPTKDGEEDCTIGDCIPDETHKTPEVTTNDTVISDEIENILSTLSNREHDIICMVYGLNGCHEMSYDEIARKFSLSGERIRQITISLLKSFRADKKFVDKFKSLL